MPTTFHASAKNIVAVVVPLAASLTLLASSSALIDLRLSGAEVSGASISLYLSIAAVMALIVLGASRGWARSVFALGYLVLGAGLALYVWAANWPWHSWHPLASVARSGDAPVYFFPHDPAVAVPTGDSKIWVNRADHETLLRFAQAAPPLVYVAAGVLFAVAVALMLTRPQRSADDVLWAPEAVGV